MSTTDNTNNRRSSAKTRHPDLLGYAVRPIGDGKKASWSKIAAAWAHKDGHGFEVRMDALPVDGRLVLRTATEVEQGDAVGMEMAPSSG